MKQHCRHDWSQWDQYEVNGTCQVHPFSKHTLPFSEVRQQRRCAICNKVENEQLPGGTRIQKQPTQQEMINRAGNAMDMINAGFGGGLRNRKQNEK